MGIVDRVRYLSRVHTAYFDLRLTPNRSLGRRDAARVLLAVGAVFVLLGARLWVLGAWPVVPFMVIDLALLWWAFGASRRSGAAFETLRLDDAALHIRTVTHRGTERRVALEPYWTRVQLERVSDLENRLWLACRGQRVRVAECLSPTERVAVHDVIADGLRRCRAG